MKIQEKESYTFADMKEIRTIAYERGYTDGYDIAAEAGDAEYSELNKWWINIVRILVLVIIVLMWCLIK